MSGSRRRCRHGRGVVVPDDVRSDFIHEHAGGPDVADLGRVVLSEPSDGIDELADLVAGAADDLGHATTALDLYSGVGLFAGVLAARGWSVTAVESAKSAVE